MSIIKPILEVVCLCAGAAAGIFLVNFVSEVKEKKEQQGGCCGHCHHDADGDCCGHCHCEENKNNEE